MEDKKTSIFDVLSGKAPLKTSVQIGISPEIVFTVLLVLTFLLIIKLKK